MNYKELTGQSIKEGFSEFHKNNPQVYQSFERQALRAIHKGRKKISAKLIINWIRWNDYMDSNDTSFRINDAFQSYYARLFVAKHPEHRAAFNFRKLRNEEEGPYVSVGEDGQLSFY